MKIALCHEAVVPRRGGCETYIANLARWMVRDGHEVHLISRVRDQEAIPPEVCFHPVAVSASPRFLRPWFFSTGCKRILERSGVDVSIGFDKVAGVDVLYPQAGVYPASVGFNLLKHPSPLVRWLLRTSKKIDPTHLSYAELERRGCLDPGTTVIAISDMVRRHLAEYYPTTEGRVRILHIATPPERLDETDRPRRRLDARARWSLGTGDVAALFVGMNYRLKGIIPLLHAMTQVPSTLHLLIAGKPDTSSYERLAESLGVARRVRFLGYCADMRDAYFASDLLVHPTFYDPCSNVVLEALACGLPVVTTRNNGASELLRLVEGGEAEARAEGYVVSDPHDYSRLAACLTHLLDRDRRMQCAAAARVNAAGWTFAEHYRRLLGILSEVAAGRARRAA